MESKDLYKIGVLAYKGKDDAMTRWQEHGNYLNQKFSPIQFKIIPLSYKNDEMTKAVERGQVDFIITNPGHYMELELGGHVSRLATRRMSGPEGILDQFGGTAITLPSRTDIEHYTDLEGKTVVIPSQSSLGGWQVHLREAVLQGSDLRNESKIIELKNHRKVVESILRGEADAGFVRSDLLEQMEKNGELQLSQLKIVNQVSEAGYPYLLSTRLYPEWPFAKVTGVPHDVAIKIVYHLMNIPSTSPAAKSAGIFGWTIPGHYSSVGDLFREVGLGPYTPKPPTLLEVINRFWKQIIVVILATSTLLLFITLRLLRANLLLRANEKELQQAANVFKYAEEGIIITDSTTSIVDVNEAFSKTTGYERKEIIGQFPSLLHSGRQAPQFYDEMWKKINEWGFWSGVLWNKKKNGTLYAEQLTITSIKNREDEVCQYVGIFRDITKQLENDEKLKNAVRAKDDFLASMSHELRTPLTSIIGNSEMLAEKLQDQHHLELIRSIEIAGRSQLALVNDILDMSKIESGKFSIEEIPYDFNQMLKDVEGILQNSARINNLEFIVKARNSEYFKLLGDSHRVCQILTNLIGNALKFTSHGEVILTTWVDGESLLFEVKDTGIGMTEEEQKNLFNRFEQADKSISRSYGGSGLGLSISSALAGMMAGTITVHSVKEEGSTFLLTLPYRSSAIPLSEEQQVIYPAQALNEKLSGNILIAEDTPELQLLERRILERMGLSVTIAQNGQEAVDTAFADSFDLILMDMQMPVMDGITACQILKSQGNQTPIIALTANVMQKHRELFSEAGCDGFLAKPIDKQELRRVLEQFLN
ncbi:MAG TPA: PhnD/SsuA/transferrin family substrate-binding protein [Gammaproteobacteria bacterium]|nr:PhnD/SsuA/transferrin family substrate-binding protein [Gammaproteobacteria bacterium]